MARLRWNSVGERFFQTGLDRGVLYPMKGRGVPWNGLVSVDESPSGGDAQAYYVDGLKTVNEAQPEEFEATISAYTYPEEFETIDGSAIGESGISYGQQPRQKFNLSYRTKVGNDVDGVDHAYKIHLIFNALAAPSSVSNQTMDDEVEPSTFSWDITTTPELVSGRLPTAHISIDSRNTPAETLSALEDILYGTSKKNPRFPTMSEIIDLFDDWPYLQININYATGLYRLTFNGAKDLKGDVNSGIYRIPTTSRLEEREISGIYRMG